MLGRTDDESIRAVISRFYCAFDNRIGRAIAWNELRVMFIPEAVITYVGEDGILTMSVDAFIEPRARMLKDGTLRDFHEWETSDSTLVLRDIKVRQSTYEKRGSYLGNPYSGVGRKLIQLVGVVDDCKICAIAWEDDR